VSYNAMTMARAVRRQPIATKTVMATRRYLRQALSLLAIGVMLALIFVWARIQVIQLGYEVSRIRKEVTDLKRQHDLLSAEVGQLKSPDRLAGIASDRFGMRLPMGDEVVILRRQRIKQDD